MHTFSHSKRFWKHSQQGFTLIEILVSTTLLVFLLMTAVTMFMTFLVSNAKTNVRHIIKGEGTAAISRMERLIRNAESLTIGSCSAGGSPNTSVRLKNFNDPVEYTISLSSGSIAYETPTATNESGLELLTSSATEVTILTFKCYGVTDENRRIEISFTLSSDADTINNSTPITENFRSTVQIRN